MLRKKILIRGVVQAVGFRPFVYNSARANKLSGFVFNSGKGVVIEAQGAAGALQKFTRALQKNPPPLSKIESVKIQNIAVKKETGFKIKTTRRARAQTSAPADIAVCKNCKKDIAGVKNRRYRYAFANCTNCGPRYTIIKNLPYDRAQTTMARFKMCPACKAEFDNPKNRRFHAQPNCCPACGPRLEFIYKSKSAGGIEQAAQKIKEGKIIAIKSLGGFHLACNALDKTALARLRARKRRPHKPLALMAGDIKTIKKYCHVNAAEEQLLKSKEAPVVMLKKKVEIPLISDGLATTGFMLPYTPLHKILFDILGPRPLVMTSGNISGQPICIDNKEAQKTLAAVADGFLLHNRPIHNRMDDSVLFELNGKTHFLRRARGYAPGSLRLPAAVKKPTLALGGDLTSAFCLAKGDKAYLSQYIGDLDNAANAAYYKETLKKMRRLLNINPKVFVRDLHPNYFSAAFKPRATKAQHHLAHALSVAAEHNIKGRFLAFTFDGAGLGANGEIWGAEFLVINKNTWRKAGGFKPVQILGGDSAAEDIRKCAASYMLAAGLSAPKAAAIKDINSYKYTGAGRLFDAAASILGLCQKTTYQAQGAMLLEGMAQKPSKQVYPFKLQSENGQISVDTAGIIKGLIKNRRSPRKAAAAFHNTLAEIILAAARKINIKQVALSGGVFQNKILLAACRAKLGKAGFRVYTNNAAPAGDGGLALGQLYAKAKNFI